MRASSGSRSRSSRNIRLYMISALSKNRLITIMGIRVPLGRHCLALMGCTLSIVLIKASFGKHVSQWAVRFLSIGSEVSPLPSMKVDQVLGAKSLFSPSPSSPCHHTCIFYPALRHLYGPDAISEANPKSN